MLTCPFLASCGRSLRYQAGFKQSVLVALCTTVNQMVRVLIPMMHAVCYALRLCVV